MSTIEQVIRGDGPAVGIAEEAVDLTYGARRGTLASTGKLLVSMSILMTRGLTKNELEETVMPHVDQFLNTRSPSSRSLRILTRGLSGEELKGILHLLNNYEMLNPAWKRLVALELDSMEPIEEQAEEGMDDSKDLEEDDATTIDDGSDAHSVAENSHVARVAPGGSALPTQHI